MSHSHLNLGPLLEEADRQENSDRQLILTAPQMQSDVVDEENEMPGKLWLQLKSQRTFTTLTNFTEGELQGLYYDMLPVMAQSTSKGPPPKVCMLDGLICTLIWYKLNANLDELGALLKFSVSSLRSALDRAHPVLLETLKRRWAVMPRPRPLAGTNFPYIGLLIDSTSIEVHRPKARFDEAKAYWDGKNCIYALKVECGVQASPPHFGLFFQTGRVGSVHDFAILKQTAPSYQEYLAKTTEEKAKLTTDQSDSRWAILGDKGYVGPPEATPQIRRIFVSKSPTTTSEELRNRELSKLRVHVECWFGRLKRLWKFLRMPYKLDHKSFDQHFQILALLTNEHIRHFEMTEDDSAYYRAHLAKMKKKYEDQKTKRREEVERYQQRKKRRLDRLL